MYGYQCTMYCSLSAVDKVICASILTCLKNGSENLHYILQKNEIGYSHVASKMARLTPSTSTTDNNVGKDDHFFGYLRYETAK